ncbi:MAG TPA: RNA polymerase sigma factor [Saprospiraceae bacterium]|nr:RNA polymerase sigma factor [Saprospiraceae bacterium]
MDNGINEIIEKVRAHDRPAQSRLYELYKNSIYTLAKRIVKDDQLAEQVLQDAFIEVFKSIHAFRNESTLYSWMRVIAVRKSLKVLKSLESEILTWRDEIPDTLTHDAIDPPNVDAERLENAFVQLSPGFRTVLTLYYIEDMSHKEISEFLNIAIGTSKSQLHHAKTKLKEILEYGQ